MVSIMSWNMQCMSEDGRAGDWLLCAPECCPLTVLVLLAFKSNPWISGKVEAAPFCTVGAWWFSLAALTLLGPAGGVSVGLLEVCSWCTCASSRAPCLLLRRLLRWPALSDLQAALLPLQSLSSPPLTERGPEKGTARCASGHTFIMCCTPDWCGQSISRALSGEVGQKTSIALVIFSLLHLPFPSRGRSDRGKHLNTHFSSLAPPFISSCPSILFFSHQPFPVAHKGQPFLHHLHLHM